MPTALDVTIEAEGPSEGSQRALSGNARDPPQGLEVPLASTQVPPGL
jgi:hypothetical protein